MKPFISLCMIVKDEEAVLSRCLNSVKGLVDEVVIADTGSTDNTKNIALQFTPNVYDFKWIDDFSAARNFVQSKANGKWIIYLDADEYVDRDNLNNVIEQLRGLDYSNTYDAFVVTQVNFVGTLAGNVTQTPTVRIYKNLPTIYFERKIHEQLKKLDGDITVDFLDLYIYHSGYLSNVFNDKNKSDRNLSLIMEELEKNPNDGFDYYNLGNEFLASGKVEEALYSFQKAFQLKGSINMLWVPNCVERIIFCLLELKKFNEALAVIKDAITQWPNAVDFRSQKALIYFMQHRYEDAEKEASWIIENRDVVTSVQSLSYKDYLPYFILGRINEYQNDLNKAIYNYSLALNFNDKDIDTLTKFYPILFRNEPVENIVDFVLQNESMKNDINKAYLLKIGLNYGEVELVESLLREWKIIPSDGLKVKLNLGKSKFNYARSILNKNSMKDLLNEGWIDSYDILMMAVQLDKKELFDHLLVCLDNDELNDLEYLFNQSKKVDFKKVGIHIIRLIERCILLKNFTLIDKILPLVEQPNIKADIGDLFFKHGFKVIAIELYSALDDSYLLNEQSFINIIDFFRESENDKEVLQWGLHALELNFNDFRIYKSVLQILNKLGEFNDLKEILQIAMKIYPDSDYLNHFNQHVKI